MGLTQFAPTELYSQNNKLTKNYLAGEFINFFRRGELASPSNI